MIDKTRCIFSTDRPHLRHIVVIDDWVPIDVVPHCNDIRQLRYRTWNDIGTHFDRGRINRVPDIGTHDETTVVPAWSEVRYEFQTVGT